MLNEHKWYLVDHVYELMPIATKQAIWKQRLYHAMLSYCVELRQAIPRTVETEEGQKQVAGRPHRPLLINDTGAKQVLAEAGVDVSLLDTLKTHDIPLRLTWRVVPYLVSKHPQIMLDAQALQRAHPDLVLQPSDRAAPITAYRFKQLISQQEGLLELYLEPDITYVE